MYKLYLIKDDSLYDISEISGNISWNDNIDTLGVQFNFSVAFNIKDKYLPNFNIKVGDKIIFKNIIEIFRGIIITQNNTSNYSISFTAFDFAFYLNKSMIIKQFNKIKADKAIYQLCNDVGINVGSIAPMNKLINKIYKDNTISDIIKDIINQETAETNKKYIMEMQGEKFCIIEKLSEPITALFKPSSNIEAFNITSTISNPSRSLSIEEMKNSITIISDSENSVRILANAKDDESIRNYGLLSLIETFSKEDNNSVNNIAQNKLKDLNKISETIKIELLGDDNIKSGRILQLVEESTGINGNYMIKNCNHTLVNNTHKISVDLESTGT